MTHPNKGSRHKQDATITKAAHDEAREANRHLKLGVGLGALGAGAAAIGAFCPLCVVIPPAFIASGLWKHHKRKLYAEQATQAPLEDAKDGSVA